MTVAPHTFGNETISHPGPSNLVAGRRDALSVRLRGGTLPVLVEHREDGLVAMDSVSGMFGEGPELGSAVKDLIEHLKISRKDLEAHKERLAPGLMDELNRLRFLLGE